MENITAAVQLPHPTLVATATETVSSALVDNLSMSTMTLAENKAVFKRVIDGAITPDEVREAFERLVRDHDSIKAELRKHTVKELEKIARPNYRGEKKDWLIEMAYRQMMTEYGFLTVTTGMLSLPGYTLEDRVAGLRAKLSKLTPDLLAGYRERHLAAKAEMIAHLEKNRKALDNPETLEEFSIFIRMKGEDTLTPEQRACRDALVAESLQEKKSERDAEKAKVTGVETKAKMAIIETRHTRDHYDLFVVQLSERIDRAEFDQLSIAAKRLSGWYSSYRRDGAIPGFQFKTREAAEQFQAIGRGEEVDVSDRMQARQAEKKESAADRLIEMANRLEEKANASLTKPRKTNTNRRARMASRMESAANSNIALAKTMRNLAAAIADGRAQHLGGLRERAQVEQLASMLVTAKYDEVMKLVTDSRLRDDKRSEPPTETTVNYVKFPVYSADSGSLSTAIRNLEGKPGFVRIVARLRKSALTVEKAKGDVAMSPDFVEEIIDRLGAAAEQKLPYYWVSAHDKRKRLARMGITCVEQLRMALREYLLYREEKRGLDKAVQLERALVGKKIGTDFFPTPASLAERMVEMADIQPGHRVLEPEAGSGNIAVAIRAAGVEPDVVEVSHALREVLEAKQFKLVGWDFMDIRDVEYDRIVMNPPFSADMAHVRHAYSLLAEDGKLVAIVSAGVFYRQGKAESEFRDWLDELGAEVEQLPHGTFNDPSLLATTMTSASLIVLAK